MDYRDERDALRGRVENLEQALREAKHELEAERALAAGKDDGEAAPSDEPPAAEADDSVLSKLPRPLLVVFLISFFGGPPLLLIGLCALSAVVVRSGEYTSDLEPWVTLTLAGAALVAVYVGGARLALARLDPPKRARAVGWDVMMIAGVAALVLGAGWLAFVTTGAVLPGSGLAAAVAWSWMGVALLVLFFVWAPRIR